MALTADLGTSVRLEEIPTKEFPERCFNFGIAEQDMVGAQPEWRWPERYPFVTTHAAFASMRATEQIRTDVAYNKLPVRSAPATAVLALLQAGRPTTPWKIFPSCAPSPI